MWDHFIKRVLSKGSIDQSKPLYGYLLKDEADDGSSTNSRDYNHMIINLCLWLNSHPDITDFAVSVNAIDAVGAVVNVRLCQLWVFFQKKKDHTAFSKWLDNYRKWFTNLSPERSLFPPFPYSGEHKISLIDVELPNDYSGSYPEEFVEKWAWVIQNCRHPVFVMPTRGLAFTNYKDAIHFKLRWV